MLALEFFQVEGGGFNLVSSLGDFPGGANGHLPGFSALHFQAQNFLRRHLSHLRLQQPAENFSGQAVEKSKFFKF
jgi:hypothetical protein